MKPIFVFGSNLAGRHGKGAALTAKKQYGAKYGQGFGLQGNSFAIPTKDQNIQTLSLPIISSYIDMFITFASIHPEYQFNITKIGCGLAGYNWEKDIFPLFPNPIPNNCQFI